MKERQCPRNSRARSRPARLRSGKPRWRSRKVAVMKDSKVYIGGLLVNGYCENGAAPEQERRLKLRSWSLCLVQKTRKWI